MPTLYLPAVPTTTERRLATVAAMSGHEVRTVRSEADVDRDGDGFLHGGPRWAASVADRAGLGLLEPWDDWLPGLPSAFLRRQVVTATLGTLDPQVFPAFVKQPRDKGLPARVYSTADDVHLEADLRPETPLLVSEAVRFEREYRFLALDGEVADGSRYLIEGALSPAPVAGEPLGADARAFVDEVLDEVGDSLPSAVVVDVGWIGQGATSGPGWAVVEANMAWFSDIYECAVDLALEVVRRSSGPRAHVAPRDVPFLRTPLGLDPVEPSTTAPGNGSAG